MAAVQRIAAVVLLAWCHQAAVEAAWERYTPDGQLGGQARGHAVSCIRQQECQQNWAHERGPFYNVCAGSPGVGVAASTKHCASCRGQSPETGNGQDGQKTTMGDVGAGVEADICQGEAEIQECHPAESANEELQNARRQLRNVAGPASTAAPSPMSVCAGQEQMEEDFYSLLVCQESAGQGQGEDYPEDQDEVIRRALASAPRDLPPSSNLTTPQRRTHVPPMTPISTLQEQRAVNPAVGSEGVRATRGVGKAAVGAAMFPESPLTPAALDPYMTTDGPAFGAASPSVYKAVHKKDNIRHGIKHGATSQHLAHAPN